MELSGRNESKPHLMSPEMAKSGKPSRYLNGEGCHAATSNRQEDAVDSGGVSEDDTIGRKSKVSWENSGSMAGRSQPPVQGGNPFKAERATREVGALHKDAQPVTTNIKTAKCSQEKTLKLTWWKLSVPQASTRELSCYHSHRRCIGRLTPSAPAKCLSSRAGQS